MTDADRLAELQTAVESSVAALRRAGGPGLPDAQAACAIVADDLELACFQSAGQSGVGVSRVAAAGDETK